MPIPAGQTLQTMQIFGTSTLASRYEGGNWQQWRLQEESCELLQCIIHGKIVKNFFLKKSPEKKGLWEETSLTFYIRVLYRPFLLCFSKS